MYDSSLRDDRQHRVRQRNGGVPASTRGRVGSSVVARRPARRQSSYRHRADRPPPTTARACGDLSSGKWVKDPPMFVEHGRQDKQYSSKEASKGCRNIGRESGRKSRRNVAENELQSGVKIPQKMRPESREKVAHKAAKKCAKKWSRNCPLKRENP